MDDSVYDQFSTLERTHWWFQGRRRVVAGMLRDHLVGGAGTRQILDVGSGTGEMLDMLREFGSVRGVDMSPKAVAYCRERFGDAIDVQVGRLPDDLSPADMVTAFDVIEHLDDDAGALERIHAVLPPGGQFVCTVPAFQFLWSAHDEVNHHRRRYTRRMLRERLQAAGFQVERISYFNTLLFPVIAGARLFRRGTSETPSSDIGLPPRWANALLLQLFAGERWLLRLTSLPVGVSLLAICRKSS